MEAITIEEWEWRLEGLQGRQGYFLVNVSSLNRTTLLHQIKELLN